MRYLALLVTGLLLAACGAMERTVGIPDPFAIPHPFQGEGDPEIVGEVLGERSVYIAPIAGLDPKADAALRAAIVTNAEAMDILASAAEIPGSLTLAGKSRDASTVDFALYDARKLITQFTASGDAATLPILAARSLAAAIGAAPVAPVTAPAPDVPAPEPRPPGTASIPARAVKASSPAAYVSKITAPDPGQAEPLKRAIADALAGMGVRMSDAATADAYAIAGALAVSPDVDGKTGITIVWTVYAPDGSDLGKAQQQNTLPTGAVRKDWPEQAALAGGAAASSVVQIIAAHFNSRK